MNPLIYKYTAKLMVDLHIQQVLFFYLKIFFSIFIFILLCQVLAS